MKIKMIYASFYIKDCKRCIDSIFNDYLEFSNRILNMRQTGITLYGIGFYIIEDLNFNQIQLKILNQLNENKI